MRIARALVSDAFGALFVLAIGVVSTERAARAQPSPPPPVSQDLGRATAAYDQGKFDEAALRFHEILQQRGTVSQTELETAEFFLGMTLVHMEYPAAAMGFFERITTAPGHRFREASAKWIVEIAEATRHPSADSVVQQLADVVESSRAIDEDTRPALRFHLARYAMRSDPARAIALFEKVPAGSARFARAQLAITLARFLRNDVDGALRAAATAARDSKITSDVAMEVVLEVDAWSRRLGARERADGLLEELARGTSPSAAFAALALARRSLERDGSLVPSASVRTWTMAVLATACARADGSNAKDVDDIAPALRSTAHEGAGRIRALLDEFSEDNAELHDAVQKALKSRDGTTPRLLQMALYDRDTRELQRFDRALGRELQQIENEDRAWQTSTVAAEVLQEVTIQRSVAQADLGKRFGHRMLEIERELRDFEAAWQNVKAPVAVVRTSGSPRRGFVITDTMCATAIGKQVPTRAIAISTPVQQPMSSPRNTGCASCAGAAAGSESSSVIAWIAIAFVAFRRRVYSKCRCLSRAR